MPGELAPWAILLLLCAFTLPFFFSDVPPLVDLPGHLGRYRVQLDLGSSEYLRRWYDFHWRLVPNLGVDLLVQLFAPAFGLEPTVKVIAAAIPPLTAASFLWTSKEVHGRIPPTSYFALPLAFNYGFQLGFLNFCLSMGLAFAAFGLWLRLGRAGQTTLRSALFVPLGALLWLAHIYGWATLVLLCLGAEFGQRVRAREQQFRWRAALTGTLAAVLPLSLPLLLIIVWSDQGAGPTSRWFALDVTAGWLVSILRDRWIGWDLASAMILFGLIGTAILRRPAFRFDPTLIYGAAALWLVCLLCPQKLFGSGYAAARLVPYATALTILAIRPAERTGGRTRQWILWAAVAFCAARLASGSLSYALYGRTLDRQLLALHSIPEGSAVLAFVEAGCDQWANSRLAHLPSYAIGRRSSFSNDQWQTRGGQLLTITYARAGKFSADPSSAVEDRDDCGPPTPRLRTVLPHVTWEAFDYLWLIDVPERLWPRTPALKEVWTSGESVLFRIEDTRPAPQAIHSPNVRNGSEPNLDERRLPRGIYQGAVADDRRRLHTLP